jgi:protease PrsW
MMDILGLLLLSIIPSVVIFAYIYQRDSGGKEPKRLLVYAFLLGVVLVIPAVSIEILLGASPLDTRQLSLAFLFYEAFIAVALVEEGMKYLAGRYWAQRQADFDEMYDGIMYVVVITLGFATLENISYVLDGGVTIAIIRGLLTVPMHALGAVIIGYYIAKQKFNYDNERFLIVKALFWPIVLHGSFNFILSLGRLSLFPLLFVVMGVYVLLVSRIFTRIRESRDYYLAHPISPPVPPRPVGADDIGEPNHSARAQFFFWLALIIMVIIMIAIILILVIVALDRPDASIDVRDLPSSLYLFTR